MNLPDTKKKVGEGSEQKAYLIDNKFVLKTNTGIFYNSWEDYLTSLSLHNYFFPDTAYELIGFIEQKGKLMSVVKQIFVEETESTDLDIVKKFMQNNGFENTKKSDYKNVELGIILEDLHEGNVLTRNGVLYFIDTVFYVSLNPKMETGGKLKTKPTFMVIHICTETGGMKRPKFNDKDQAEKFAKEVDGEVIPI